jgi:dTMP kinase
MAGVKKGKLIVIEGNDGSGKTTQLNLLLDYLKRKKIPHKTMDFPQYYDSFFGKFLAAFLRREHGKLEHANPYLLTFPFAMDRASAAPKIRLWLNKGYFVICNRYATSNMAHQSGRLPKKERSKYVDWDLEFEYKINKLPKEDKVIFLHLPYRQSLKLMAQRTKRNYINGKNKDMVETNVSYIRNSEEAYLQLLERFPHWIKIECLSKGKLRTPEDIHEEVKKTLKI